MRRIILTRLALAIPLLFGIATMIFIITHILPGDPTYQVAGPNATPENLAAIRERLGLDLPLWHQYLNYLGQLVRGNLGNSLISNTPVRQELFSRMGATLLLVTIGSIAATIYGITLGALIVFSRRFGIIGRGLTTIGLATPDFVLGIVLTFIFFFKLNWAPAPVGQVDFGLVAAHKRTGAVLIDSLLGGEFSIARNAAAHLVLPVLSLALVYGAPIAKVAEQAFRDVRGASFMEYAKLMGLRRLTKARYLTRNALPATLTFSGAAYAYLLGGVVLIETVFSWGGVAQYAAKAIAERDLNVIQGFVLMTGVLTLIIYLLLDLFYVAMDPRSKV